MIYDAPDLDGFASVPERLEGYLRPIAGYQKNEYAELPQARRQGISREWQRSFDEWDYPR